jgi:hypothetical protein
MNLRIISVLYRWALIALLSPLICVQVANVTLGTQVKHSLEKHKHQIEMEGDRLANKCWSEQKEQ